MPLIKYYNWTCYDGGREFVFKPGNKSRYYPDEYLIAEILNKYKTLRFPEAKNIVTVTEPWFENKGRDGERNTEAINTLVLEKIKEVENEPEPGLMLVPFLYGYHHPGMTIDIKNKRAIYLDPKAWNYSAEARQLEIALKANGYAVEVVMTNQQPSDCINCGPILTASMIKFMEEFMSTGTITTEGFKSPRPNYATDRVFQIYVNNAVMFDENKRLVDEIMLVDTVLWTAFLQEQGIDEPVCDKLCKLVKEQKRHTENAQALACLQAKIIEHIFLETNKKKAAENIEALLVLPVANWPDLAPTNEQGLLCAVNVHQTVKVLGLSDYAKVPSAGPEPEPEPQEPNRDLIGEPAGLPPRQDPVQPQQLPPKPDKPVTTRTAQLKKISDEILRLSSSTKASWHWLVMLGILEASDSKIAALASLFAVLMQNKSAAEMKQDIVSWKVVNEGTIATQRNCIHSFFSNHKPDSQTITEEILAEWSLT